MPTIMLPAIKTGFVAKLTATGTSQDDATKFGDAIEKYGNDNGFTTSATLLDDITTDQKGFIDNEIIKGAGLKKGHVTTLKKMLEEIEKPTEEPKPTSASVQPPPLPPGQPALQLPTRLPVPTLGNRLLSNLSKATISEVSPEDLVAGFQVMLAYEHNLFDTADRVRAAILERAKSQKKQVHPFFHKISKLLNRRAAADVLNAMGVSGENVNERVRNEFLSKFVSKVVPAVQIFHSKLVKAFDAHQAIASNPAAMQQAMMNMVQVMAGGQPGLVAPSAKFDSKSIRMALTTLIEVINEAYSPLGVPANRALLAEASEINEFLGNEDLRTAIGVTSREEVLIELKVGLTEEQLSEETGLAQYILGVMELPKQPAGSNQELLMVMELIQLGNSLTTLVAPVTPPRTSNSRSGNDLPYDGDYPPRNASRDYRTK